MTLKPKLLGSTSGADKLASGLAIAALALLAGFISLPLLSLVIWTVGEGSWRAMASPVALDALLLSAKTTAVTMTMIFVVGTPAAFVLSRAEFPGKRLVNALVDIPAVLPPSAAGIALLLADAAVALSVLVLGFSFAVILAARFFTRRAEERAGQSWPQSSRTAGRLPDAQDDGR